MTPKSPHPLLLLPPETLVSILPKYKKSIYFINVTETIEESVKNGEKRKDLKDS